jgi:hypothetical protein
LPLTEENLVILQGESAGDMDSKKRKLSPLEASSGTSTGNQSLAFYRYSTLKQAGIYIVPDSPPKEIQAAVDGILSRVLDDARAPKIADLAEGFSMDMVREQIRPMWETRFRDLVSRTLEALDKDHTLCHIPEAGIVIPRSDIIAYKSRVSYLVRTYESARLLPTGFVYSWRGRSS